MRAKASLRLRAGSTSGLRLVLQPASESRRVCLRLPPSTCPNLARIAPAGFIRSHSVSTSRSRPIKPGGGLISSGLGICGATSLRVSTGRGRSAWEGRGATIHTLTTKATEERWALTSPITKSQLASLKLSGSLRRRQLFSQYELFKMRFHLGSLLLPVVVIYERWINIWLSFLLKQLLL